MANRLNSDATIPSGFADVAREPHAMRISHAEEGESRGEGWFFARALALLAGVIIAVGWLIG